MLYRSYHHPNCLFVADFPPPVPLAPGTKLADFLVIIAGLLLGWVAFLYCLGNAVFWR
jgi:hypothetical protein